MASSDTVTPLRLSRTPSSNRPPLRNGTLPDQQLCPTGHIAGGGVVEPCEEQDPESAEVEVVGLAVVSAGSRFHSALR